MMNNTTNNSEILRLFSGLAGCEIVSHERIGGGRNSRVYRLTCDNSETYAGKQYFRHGSDDRDRLGVEFSGLSFLRKHGVRCIPRPVAQDSENACAVYEYIDGDRIRAEDVNDADIDFAVGFLANLRGLTAKKGSEMLPPASEACFSVHDLVRNISGRMERLGDVQDDSPSGAALRDFLDVELLPEFESAVQVCRKAAGREGLSYEAEIPRDERTLSPSDFGFHNALRRRGEIVFVDFEYFGWDDPAKTVSDFLLHPAVNLDYKMKQRFFSGVFTAFSDCGNLRERFRIVYPLYGFKWCAILLNEFVPGHLERRDFAANDEQNREKLLAGQLVKSRTMLKTILEHKEKFPYEFPSR